MTKYVTKKERKIANARALKIVRDLQKCLAPDYRIDSHLVGSAKYNAVVCDDRGVYDMDYQLILTNNCRYFDADKVRKDFFKAFNKIRCKNEKVENSTSVITVRVSNSRNQFVFEKEMFSFDFAIICEDERCSYIIRRGDTARYVWNRLPSRNSYIYKKFYSLDCIEQRNIIEHVIERKIKEKKKPKDQRISSSIIFMEEVNNYGGHI